MRTIATEAEVLRAVLDLLAYESCMGDADQHSRANPYRQ